MAALFAMGAVSITIGLSIRSVQADQIFQQKEQYDGDGTPDRNAACKIKEANAGTEKCEISIAIKDKMESPVYRPAHRENLKKDDLSTCSPLKSNGSKTLNPCGVIANSLFNDVISLSDATELAHGISMRENHLAWKSDLNDNGLPEGCMGYVCEGGDFDSGHCDEGQAVLYYYRDHDEFQFLYETFPDIVSPIVGVKNEHFVVWMRLAGLAEFKKLYGRITDTLHDGWTPPSP
ncbi:aminophospholipid transmembrane transporter [Aureococcus anophagefferens]|uniref:Aminophospholipid transmembrane transporter n=1 Tax=Aureococcus anophagefferens TaxID=44056 RepID=A0ABR1FM15_AURAN